jgi:hypothetical protein
MKSQKQQLNQQIDLTKTIPLVCATEDCGNEVFMPVMKFRKVPKLMAGSTKDQIVPIQVFICTSCGAIPEELDFNV